MNSERFDYELMEPPEVFPPFEQMSAAHATRHFEWFIAEAPSRIRQIREAYAHSAGSEFQLDFTVESLVPLWRWLSGFVEIVAAETPKRTLPQWATAVGITNRQLKPSTLALGVDTGFYIAEIFMRTSKSVRWVLWTKTKDYYWNRPVLIGFGPYPLVPHDLVVANFWKVARREFATDQLLRSFKVWQRKLSGVRANQ